MTLSPTFWLIFLGGALLFTVFINNKIGMLIILATVFLFNWLFGVIRIIPKEITWLPDIIIIALTAKMLYLQARKSRFKRTTLDTIILAIVTLGLLSALYNHVPAPTFIFGFRNFFKYVLLFYILRNVELDSKFYKPIVMAMFALALIQIPVTIAQTIKFGIIGEDVADNVSGTLGWKATGAMAMLMSFAISMMIGFYSQTRKRIFLLLTIGFLLPMILGSGQFGFYIAPPAVVLCWLAGHRWTWKNILKLPLIFMMMGLIGWFAIKYHDIRYEGNFEKFLRSPEKLYQLNMELRKEGAFGRFQVVKVANDLLARNGLNLLIGYGPGNASESFFKKYSGKLDQQHMGRKIGGIQFTAIILEFGYVGLLLYGILFYKLWRMSRRVYRRVNDPFWRAVAVGYVGMLFSYVVGIIYNPVWFYDVLAFPFWFISAALVILDETAKIDIADGTKKKIELAAGNH
ncbi:MAG: O-antigen ligase family protein [Candidatus Zhuqueibacterota bacterium]